MVDRGFLIEETCQKNQWTMMRPPFLKEQPAFSKNGAIITAEIAKARVHVERLNQRLKILDILGTKAPSKVVPILEDIFRLCCVTINLSLPIISDKHFVQDS